MMALFLEENTTFDSNFYFRCLFVINFLSFGLFVKSKSFKDLAICYKKKLFHSFANNIKIYFFLQKRTSFAQTSFRQKKVNCMLVFYFKSLF